MVWIFQDIPCELLPDRPDLRKGRNGQAEEFTDLPGGFLKEIA
jgi:hypothetical protein